MQKTYQPFTAEMKAAGYTILVPNMLPMHFRLLLRIFGHYGYNMELLTTTGRHISDTGLKYVHNDTCYPAILVIGQFIDALQSGKYDPHKVALMLFQTGGGCRASNYISLLRKALEKAGYRVHSFVFPAGEGSKNLSTYADVLHFLGEHRFSRSDVVVALGGGVVGDLAGFAAATYQRGMGFAQIPTTLLAAVDSSVGGKTAVDLPTGKNQAGSFYQPCIVICDPNTLETLPEEQYRCGCAEIIKYSMLGNAAFFEELYKTPVREQYEHVIEVCVQMKRDIVGADEYDLGRRRTLNLGHTFGHAVEQCSDFSLLHGEAVAIGMATVTRAAVKRGICGEETLARLLDILHRYGLPTETGYELDKLYEAELVDKKISGGKMHLIVPEKIGQVRMETIPVEALRDWMQDGGIR